MRVPAVVGAFPEPFRSGSDGKKLPIRLVCMGPGGPLVRRGRDAAARRRRAQRRALEPRVLARRGAADPRRALARRAQGHRRPPARGGPGGVRRLRPAVPRPGDRIALIDADGGSERTLGPGSGLVAATSYQEQHPTWLITGTDDVGVAAAAAALTEDQLRDHFALAIEPGRGVRCRSRDRDAPARCTRRAPASAVRGASRSAAVPLCCEHPALLVAVLAVEAAAALAAGLGRELRRTAAWGVPFAIVVVVINALVTRDGATVIFRGPYAAVGGADRHHARGGRLRRRARAADPRDLRHGRLPRRRRRRRRAAARPAPRLAALGRDRRAGDAPVRRAAPRRASASPTRSAACPAAAPRGWRCCTP